MKTFKGCICIAQARIISGRRKGSHICTIAYHSEDDQFLRLCVPFSIGRSPVIKRWSVFDFDGTKDGLGNDTRDETWNATQIRRQALEITAGDRNLIHSKILSQYKYESELNKNKSSIGLLIPDKSSLRFYKESYNPNDEKDLKKIERAKFMADQGIWFPEYKVMVKGTYQCEGRSKRFDKQLLSWDVYEADRRGNVDPFQQIYSYRNPYMILGNLATKRRAFMVIGIHSAPDGYIERYAINQQLALAVS